MNETEFDPMVFVEPGIYRYRDHMVVYNAKTDTYTLPEHHEQFATLSGVRIFLDILLEAENEV